MFYGSKINLNSLHVNESNGISFKSWLDLKRLEKGVSKCKNKIMFFILIVS